MASQSQYHSAFSEIDRQSDSLISFLREYVQHKSVNPGRGTPTDPGEEESCQQWLAGIIRGWGVFDSVDVWMGAPGRPNIAATASGKSGMAGIMFNGHTDTVEVTPVQRERWVGDPWSADIRDGILYGRGATDMKGGNAAFLWAAKVLRDLHLDLSSNIVLTISVAEETSEADIGPLSVLQRGYTAP
jgi:acetylornithine deacetylase